MGFESVTFYRSDDTGMPSESVDGLFFTNDLKIHARCVLSHVTVHMEVFLGYALTHMVQPPDYEIVSCNLSSLLMNIIDTHAELPRPWPVGKYELRLFINDKLLLKAPFKIVEPPSEIL
ncbi:uncharacterized protein MONOS_8606 [Monocercomonoides exilis]|uniref:uncharacterized protein n=1 Tax=Monocercomonoides exilis TaxID=2049356 RepID=UPI00355A7198|nr:hypothetical protein MONOS_8606 [Monocercomonoides exilis]|eukprot:MONOS_8606.1-p1 / transcript=MONOS_8606.1 / gene=MONOS_8606 / organism=Monocercomonoides_exilis_PA203 / gene_product=unspecified product / transcript_product=unspecified product / location=Mono_scaffold00328:46439-47278(-) / protein_length=119 / sequence_SO=supercontig / SO=protein_coding / is_pseudo=false